VDNEVTPLCAVLIPVEADVDSDMTELLVALRPVDNEVTPLCAVLIPVEADVDSDVTELLVALRPVDSDETELLVLLSDVESDVIELVAAVAAPTAVERLLTLDPTAVNA
ncbi:hypothetical protein, partial [Burkholderia stagnalis]|uniref:hypothetical protein n=1 Tax=Burkholderia stagnalis TaxID=1503054 RepID=UPI000B02AA27